MQKELLLHLIWLQLYRHLQMTCKWAPVSLKSFTLVAHFVPPTSDFFSLFVAGIVRRFGKKNFDFHSSFISCWEPDENVLLSCLHGKCDDCFNLSWRGGNSSVKLSFRYIMALLIQLNCHNIKLFNLFNSWNWKPISHRASPFIYRLVRLSTWSLPSQKHLP